jgi:hypothetical protein
MRSNLGGPSADENLPRWPFSRRAARRLRPVAQARTKPFARRGYVTGKTIVFEHFTAQGRLDRLPGMVDEWSRTIPIS